MEKRLVWVAGYAQGLRDRGGVVDARDLAGVLLHLVTVMSAFEHRLATLEAKQATARQPPADAA